jgi:hypothetical protein
MCAELISNHQSRRVLKRMPYSCNRVRIYQTLVDETTPVGIVLYCMQALFIIEVNADI